MKWLSWDYVCKLKLRCDERFTHAFTAYSGVFKEITLVASKQGTFFENATVCSKRMRKTLVATQLKRGFEMNCEMQMFMKSQKVIVVKEKSLNWFIVSWNDV